jgi:hypothetical protein
MTVGLVIAGRVRWRDRIAARWRANQLDLALATGISPEGTAALAVRARWLCELRRRRAMANSFRRIVRETGLDTPASWVRVNPRRRTVVAAASALTDLADQLLVPGPVAARGVAQAWLLLTDGTGPLYNPRSDTSLRERAVRAKDDLWLRDDT